MENDGLAWIVSGLWHLVGQGDPCVDFNSNSQSWYYGTANCNFDTGSTNWGNLEMASNKVVQDQDGNLGSFAGASFWYNYQTETTGTTWDQRIVQINVNNGGWTNVAQLSGDPMNTWQPYYIDLTPYMGDSIRLRFSFNSVDEVENGYRGWYIDDVQMFVIDNFIAGPYNSIAPATYDWVDISGDPGDIVLENCDDCAAMVPIGFTWNSVGHRFREIGISSNGYLFMPDLESDGTDWSNDGIPDNTNTPDYFLAPFWDDLDLRANGKIYAKTLGTFPNRKLIIQWKDADWFNAASTPGNGLLNFQVVISEADMSVTYQYADMLSVNAGRGSGNSATVGVEYGGNTGDEWSYNTGGVISDGMAIRLSPADDDGDGLPNNYEALWSGSFAAIFSGDPLDPLVPTTTTIDSDGDGLDYMGEFQAGTSPYDPDTDNDGLNDSEEMTAGTDPLSSDMRILVQRITSDLYGKIFFDFNVMNPGNTNITGFRVYYGPYHAVAGNDYMASFDMGPNTRGGIIDQQWGLQGVSQVFMRVAPIVDVNGRTVIGALSSEIAGTFAGDKETITVPGGEVTLKTGSKNCFIATAAYGSPYQAPVTWMRKFRDEYLLTNSAGQWFVQTYYRLSPPIADYIKAHPWLRTPVKAALLPFAGMSYVLVEASPFTQMAVVYLLLGIGYMLVQRRMRRKNSAEV